MSLEEQQLKNIKNRIINTIYKATPTTLIRVAVLCGIKVPREIYEKYMSSLGE